MRERQRKAEALEESCYLFLARVMLLLFLLSKRSSSEEEEVSLLWMACFFTLREQGEMGDEPFLSLTAPHYD